ncbi:MAG: hypothetical protein AAB110_07960 [Candidatus Desantisbacteria bacterium]
MEVIKNIATTIAAIIGIFAFIKGLLEYIRQNTLKRIDLFLQIRTKFKSKELYFSKLFDWLEIDDIKLKNNKDIYYEKEDITVYRIKYDILGFFEEVALLVNSKVIKIEIAHYMFGYYIMKIFDSKHFWNDSEFNKNDYLWSLFVNFATRIKEFDNKLKIKPIKINDYEI